MIISIKDYRNESVIELSKEQFGVVEHLIVKCMNLAMLSNRVGKATQTENLQREMVDLLIKKGLLV